MSVKSVNIPQLVEKQRKFFQTHKTKPVEWRIAQLKKLRSAFEQNADKLSQALYEDLRRPKEFNRVVEVDRQIREIDSVLANIKEWAAPIMFDKSPLGIPELHKDPLGVVLVIGAFNFPVDVTFNPAISAIAAGNTVVLKPSELSPHSSRAIYEMISENFDEESVACVEGDVEVSKALLAEKWDRVFYTGSPRVGKMILAAAAPHLTPVTLELGGKNPAFVLPDADLVHTAEQMVRGKWMNCGQVCLNVDYAVFFDDKTISEFIKQISAQLSKTYGDHPQKSPEYSRIVNENHYDRVANLLKETKGKVLYKSADPNDRDDLFIGPHVIQADKNDVLMEDEIFGPILNVLKFDSIPEAIEFVNQREKPLGLYIFTKSETEAKKIITHTSSGGVTVNGFYLHANVPELPFGGVGNSGMGRCHGKFGFDQFTHEKGVFTQSNL